MSLASHVKFQYMGYRGHDYVAAMLYTHKINIITYLHLHKSFLY